mgnify:CR=1 FL=1
MKYEVVPYQSGFEDAWDACVGASRAPSLLFLRRFMEYHADRFTDASVVVRHGLSIEAVFPAAIDGPGVASHPGLTYGGLVCPATKSARVVLGVASAIADYYRSRDYRYIDWSPIPRHYADPPSDADLYAIFRLGGHLVGRSLTTVWPPSGPDPLPSKKSRNARSAERKGLATSEVADPSRIHGLVSRHLLEKYERAPTHSVDELQLLKARLDNAVRFVEVTDTGGVAAAGAVVFRSRSVDHIQYFASSAEGRALRAQDLLFSTLLNDARARGAWMDFGVSTEDAGRTLNEGLLHFKEELGGQSAILDRYRIAL